MKKLLTLFITILLSLGFSYAQGGRNMVKYIRENNLYRNGDMVTITNFDLEWPLALCGDGLQSLQEELCDDLFDIDADNFEQGWKDYHKALGQRISHMPDSVTRRFVDIYVQELWFEKNRYVSLYIKKQVRDQNGKEISSMKRFLTYDFLSHSIFTKNDVFDDFEYGDYGRVPFEALIEKGASCDPDDMPNIDLTLLPKDFAIAGRAIVFGLGGIYDNDNYSAVLIDNLRKLRMLKKHFRHWLDGNVKVDDDYQSVLPHDFDSSLSSDSVENIIDSLPQYPGGRSALNEFISSNVKYPKIDLALHRQGRVIVSFIVEKDGTLSDVTVVNPVSTSLDREAVNVVKSMPRWQPAARNGKVIRTRMSLPFSFRFGAKN